MCGITGWVSFDRDLRAEAETLDAMTETMSCRGPDDRGTWTEDPRPSGTAGSRSSTCPADASP